MTGPESEDPLIMTLTLNPEAHAFFDALRTAADLTPQDRAPWSPHITIQNKVTPARWFLAAPH
jgi:hypothetical protein